MEPEDILGQLNEPQREAVTSGANPVMVLAGAGSGKTRVLVHRIAWLISVDNTSPFNVFAVTFTNKAANEMRERISEMLGLETRGMWVGTFHGLAHKFLRLHWKEAGLEQGFQVLDSDDQHRQIKKIIKEQSLDESYYPPKEVQWFINNQKDLGLRAKQVKEDPGKKQHIQLYKDYEKRCSRSGLVDFGELLLSCYETLSKNKALLEHYQQRFKNILVDEFQDTNEIQYQMVRLLSGEHGAAFVVGDDDQSIYRWRGANSANMSRFQKEFVNTRVIKMEQNYRSTKTILDAANAVIVNNNGRLEKTLWTSAESGPQIKLVANYDEYEEAHNIIDTIQSKSKSVGLNNIAVLYRSNAQSRVIEEALLQQAIPYRVYGGFRFFDRAEVKDALAYLRLSVNQNDDLAFERASSMPPKGLGAKTLNEIRSFAQTEGVSLFVGASQLVELSLISGRATNAVRNYIAQIQKIKSETENKPLKEQFEIAIHLSGLVNFLQQKKSEQSATKIDNIMELINAAHGYRPMLDEDEMTPLESFLSHAALESGDNQAGEGQDSVQLMTMHSAKGLEFPLVFIAGMEDGLFPHQRSQIEAGGLEEERRLCYVAITRSMKELYISYANQRLIHGLTNYSQPSRFLYEIPEALIDEVSNRGVLSKPAKINHKYPPKNKSSSLLGQRIHHSVFGEGVVIAIEGDGDNTRAQINFETEGTKWLVLSYTKLNLM